MDLSQRVLPLTILFFWICFSIRTSYKKLSWCTNYQMNRCTSYQLFLLFVSAGVLFEGVFSQWISSRMPKKGVRDLTLFRFWVIIKNVKNLVCVSVWFLFHFLRITQDLNIIQNNKLYFVDIGKWETC